MSRIQNFVGVHSEETREQYKIQFARFTYGDWESPDVTDFMMSCVKKACMDPRIDKEFLNFRKGDTPISMVRNDCLNKALKHGADFLLIVDSDMMPDAHLAGNPRALWVEPGAKPFWETSLNFLINRRREGRPTMVAAPYCGPPPIESVYVFKWESNSNDTPDDTISARLKMIDRCEASMKTGIQAEDALPTGLMLIDMRVLDGVDQPFCYYEHDEPFQMEKHSTEDVTLTRDVTLSGREIFCNWDAWAGHWKRRCVGKPKPYGAKDIRKKFVDAILRDHNINSPAEKYVVFKGSPPPVVRKDSDGEGTDNRGTAQECAAPARPKKKRNKTRAVNGRAVR